MFKFIKSVLLGFKASVQSSGEVVPVKAEKREFADPREHVLSLMKLFKECGLIHYVGERDLQDTSVHMAYRHKKILPSEIFAGEEAQMFEFTETSPGSFHRAHVGNLFMAAAKSLGLLGNEPDTWIKPKSYTYKSPSPEKLNLGEYDCNLYSLVTWVRYNETLLKEFIKCVTEVSKRAELLPRQSQASMFWNISYTAEQPAVVAVIYTNDDLLYKVMSNLDHRDCVATQDVTHKGIINGVQPEEGRSTYIIRIGGLKGMDSFIENANTLESAKQVVLTQSRFL